MLPILLLNGRPSYRATMLSYRVYNVYNELRKEKQYINSLDHMVTETEI